MIGLFLSFTVSGVLYSALVESGLLQANVAFAVIFGLQAVMIVACWLAIRNVTVEGLQADATPDVAGVEDDGLRAGA